MPSQSSSKRFYCYSSLTASSISFIYSFRSGSYFFRSASCLAFLSRSSRSASFCIFSALSFLSLTNFCYCLLNSSTLWGEALVRPAYPKATSISYSSTYLCRFLNLDTVFFSFSKFCSNSSISYFRLPASSNDTLSIYSIGLLPVIASNLSCILFFSCSFFITNFSII